MKNFKTFLVMFFLIFALFGLTFSANAEEQKDVYEQLLAQSGAEKLLDSLSDDSKNILKEIGVSGINPAELSNISFSSIINVIFNETSTQSKVPFRTCFSILGIMILYAVINCFNDSLSQMTTAHVLDMVTTLCITCAIVIPISNVIVHTISTIENASKFMLAYVPIMVVIMIASGKVISGSSYYSAMILAGQGVVQASANIISPMLNVFLGLSVVGSISPNINLSGFTELAGKVIRWILTFTMAIFTTVLSIKSIIATSADNVSTRALRFTMSSFIPLIGGALAEAYNTVEGSVTLLKSGLGVLVILCVGVIFLPILTQCVMWIFSIYITKAIGEVLTLNQPSQILDAVQTVLSTLFAVILCIMAIFIISTAVVIVFGGSS